MKLTNLLILYLFSTIAYGQNIQVKRIDSLIRAAHDIGVFNGNVLVAKDQKIIYKRSFGYFDNVRKKKLTSSSRMPIGSIAKEFSSTGILFLLEKRKLKLTDKVSSYFPNLPKWSERIQISHLLNYTSGLPRIYENTDKAWFKKLQTVENLEFEPGKGYRYSNANVFLQKKIIEHVTGLGYYDFLDKNLFRKPKVGFEILKDSMLTESMAHSFDNDFQETSLIHGGEKIYLTIDDLYSWAKYLYAGKIISFESMKILSKQFDDRSQSGLGHMEIIDNQVVVHNHDGSGNNYESLIDYAAENDLTIILMSNNQNFKLEALAHAVKNIMAGEPYSVPKKSIYLDIRSKLLNDFKKGIAFYAHIKQKKKEVYDFDEEVYDLYSTARYLMRRDRYDDAISILHLSILLDLNSIKGISYAYTLIAECYMNSDRNSLAGLYLEKAIELNSSNENAKAMLEKIIR